MGGEEDGDALFVLLADNVFDIRGYGGVKTGGRFVKKPQFGIVKHGTGEGKAMFHTFGEFTSPYIFFAIQANKFDEFFGIAGFNVKEFFIEIQVLFGGHFAVYIGLFKGHANFIKHITFNGFNIKSGYGDFPPLQRQKTSEDTLGGGFSCPGWSQEAKLVNSFYELELDVDETTAKFESFGRTESPLKKMLVNISLLFTSVLAGMMISLNIVEEKMDNTVSAINVSPISRVGFILGKSMMGMFLAIYGSVALVWITGYQNVNFGQMLLAIGAITLLSLVVGFIQGIANDDVMNAGAGMKMMFLPVAAAVAAVELLSDKLQILFYWVPFYWSYKGNEAILSYTSTWPQIIGYSAIVLALSSVVYYLLAPKIQKGLSA